jgi:hypothetical protein
MGMADLRRMARVQRLRGYASLSRDRLTARLLKQLKRAAARGKSL